MKVRVARCRASTPHRAFPDQGDRAHDTGSGLYARGGCGIVSVPEAPGLWLDAGCWMLVAGCSLLDAGCWMLDARCWMLDAGCWMLDAGCWLLDARCSMLVAGHEKAAHSGECAAETLPLRLESGGFVQSLTHPHGQLAFFAFGLHPRSSFGLQVTEGGLIVQSFFLRGVLIALRCSWCWLLRAHDLVVNEVNY